MGLEVRRFGVRPFLFCFFGFGCFLLLYLTQGFQLINSAYCLNKKRLHVFVFLVCLEILSVLFVYCLTERSV